MLWHILTYVVTHTFICSDTTSTYVWHMLALMRLIRWQMFICAATNVYMCSHICFYVQSHMFICAVLYVYMWSHMCFYVQSHMFICAVTWGRDGRVCSHPFVMILGNSQINSINLNSSQNKKVETFRKWQKISSRMLSMALRNLGVDFCWGG